MRAPRAPAREAHVAFLGRGHGLHQWRHQLITRDLDILGAMAAENLSCTYLTITTLDGAISRKLEPRASMPEARLRAVEELARAGAKFSGFVPLRLPYAVKKS